MENNRFLKRREIVRNAIKRVVLQFALPGMTVFNIELQFCVRDELLGFWGTVLGVAGLQHQESRAIAGASMEV